MKKNTFVTVTVISIVCPLVIIAVIHYLDAKTGKNVHTEVLK